MRFIEKIPGVTNSIAKIKELVFGEDNSRLDAILDYFFSLRQEKRAKIIFYSSISLVLIFVLIVFFYFFRLYSLQSKLNLAADNVRELNNIRSSYMIVNQEFSKLTENLQRNNQYGSIVATLEQKTKELGIENSPLPDKPPLIELQSTDPLYPQFQKIKLDYSIVNVSLKKIIDYVSTVQQMENRFKVAKLEIQQKFGTKLYFDANLTVEAYVISQNSQKGQD